MSKIKIDVNPRALKAAKQAAFNTAALARRLYQFKKAKDWPTLSRMIGVDIPGIFTELPYIAVNVNNFCQYWQNTTVERMKYAQDETRITATSPTRKILVERDVSTFGNATLLPDQEGVYRAIRQEMLLSRNIVAGLQDGETGSGKTYIAAALLAYIVQKKLHMQDLPIQLPYRLMVVTRKTIVEQYKRVLEDFGLGPQLSNQTIIVTRYSALSATFGTIFLTTEYDYTNDQDIIKFNEALAPYFVVLDECHGLNNPNTQQTKFVMAMLSCKNPPLALFMSATPFITVNSARTFILAVKLKWEGMTVNAENFSNFAGSICKRPDRPNKEAAKRLRKMLASYIFPLPKVRWKHKAINQVLIVDFANEKDRGIYQRAFEVFMEKKRQAGENTNFGPFQEFVALGQFRKAAEPLHCDQIVDLAMQDIRESKRCPVIGLAFRESVARCVRRFHKVYGIPRDKISIIWGGKRPWRQDLLLDDGQLDALMKKTAAGIQLEHDEIRALKETINYRTERIMANESEAEHARRLEELKELGLTGTQSANARQYEIDKFQEGDSIVCIFTLAAGGVGLSLDHSRPHLLPRVGYFTPVYSGPEFKQALGRTVRRTTLSDTEQFLVYLRDTIEETHVAPIVDSKLACIATITENTFNMIDLATAQHHHISTMLRTKEQVLADAEKEEAQFTSPSEDEEIELAEEKDEQDGDE